MESKDTTAPYVPRDKAPYHQAGQISDTAAVPFISVVIPTFQRAGGLGSVIDPLLADPAVLEIILVDDGSDEATAASYARLAARNPKIVIIRQEHAGEAAARSRGASAATSDVLLFLDDDVIASAGLASHHLAHHVQSPEPLVVLGYMPPRLPSPRRPGQFPVYVYARSYEQACTKYASDATSVLRNLWGGNFSVRRASFLAAASVPGKLPYHQDQVLGWRLREVGCSGRFDRSLVAEHHYRRSPEEFMTDCRRRGRALAMLAVNPSSDAVAPLDSGLSPVGSIALRAIAASPACVFGIIEAGLRISGWLRWWAVETLLARVAAFVEMYRASRRP